MAVPTKLTIGLILDETVDEQRTLERIETLHEAGQIDIARLLVISDQQEVPKYDFTISGKLYSNASLQRVATRVNLSEFIKTLQTDFIGYIPRGVTSSLRLPDISSVEFNFLTPWLPDADLPKETAKEMPVDAVAWIASRSIVQSVLPQLNELDNWTVLEVALALERSNIPFRWGAISGSKSELPKQKSGSPVPLTANATVLALVPHYRCETWLHRCLRSLVTQTRLPEGIVVIDDGSGKPPVTIVEEFPSVTLLTAPHQVGPYRLIQQVIDDTNYDAYLFQDADDWSTSDRLYKLLHAAEVSGAELVGTQELRVFEEESKLNPVVYPLDVNAALAEKPGHPLLHPSSLVARDLVQRLCGFATGLRFGGDTEFLLRAALVARIVNIPDYCYFRRKRAGSLTTAPDTGLDSAVRIELLKTLKNRALTNYTVCREGQQPGIEPLVKAEPIVLSHITGPQLSWVTDSFL